MKLNKGDIRALADKIAGTLLADYVVKQVLDNSDNIQIPQEHCPRRRDFTEVIAKEIEQFFA